MDNDTSYESFLKYQEAGLKASNIPKKLWKEPFTKFQKILNNSYTFFRYFWSFHPQFFMTCLRLEIIPGHSQK